MNKKNVYVVIVGMLLTLTSCLGEGGDSLLLASQAGVVETTPTQAICLKGGDKISSESFQKEVLSDGDCCMIDYTIDYDAAENATTVVNENGYYTAQITSYMAINKWELKSSLTDTSKVLPNEQLVSSIQNRSAYINGKFFLMLEYNTHPSDQVDQIDFSYHADLTTQVDDEGRRVYNLFVRSVKDKEGTLNTTGVFLQPNAVDVGKFIELASAKEKQAGEDKVYFHVFYAKGFLNEGTKVSWGVSDVFSVTIKD